MTDKEELRIKFKAKRADLKSPERDGAILKNFISSPFFGRTSFFVYRAVKYEVATLEIIERLLSANKEVLLPRVENGVMRSVPYSEDTETVFGIEQPKSGDEREAEIILTPLLSFDKAGFRLGYGGGYYDKYFAGHGGLRVGLAYAGQEADFIPREAFDLPLHAVITEAGVRYFT